MSAGNKSYENGGRGWRVRGPGGPRKAYGGGDRRLISTEPGKGQGMGTVGRGNVRSKDPTRGLSWMFEEPAAGLIRLALVAWGATGGGRAEAVLTGFVNISVSRGTGRP